MPSKTWGTPQNIASYVVADESTEIPSGQKAYVFNRSVREWDQLEGKEWEDFLAGDMTELKNEIESRIPGARVVWLKASWEKVTVFYYPHILIPQYKVYGFYAEAIVENTGTAGLSGLEIVTIILAVAFLVAVVTICLTAAWIIWRVIESSGAATPVIGLVILAGLGIVLLLLFGVTFSKTGKGFKVGRKG